MIAFVVTAVTTTLFSLNQYSFSAGGRMEDDIEVRLARIEQWLNHLNSRVEKLETAMYNNGVLARLKALEEKFRQLNSMQKLSLSFTIGTFLGILVMLVTILARGG